MISEPVSMTVRVVIGGRLYGREVDEVWTVEAGIGDADFDVNYSVEAYVPNERGSTYELYSESDVPAPHVPDSVIAETSEAAELMRETLR
jgi:hypothetical protein